MTAAPGAVGSLVAATSKSSSSGSSSILIFVVIGAAFYFLIFRPQQKKQKAARAQSNEFEVDDEVVTAGGIVGRVLDITDDRVTLETSVGASFVVLRPYVLRKLEPVVAPADVVDSTSEEDDHGEPEPPADPPTSPGSSADADDADADDDDADDDDDDSVAPHGDARPSRKPSTDDDPETDGSDGPSII